VFGSSNVGVQVVASLDGVNLDRTTFVGVLAMILVGISTMRVGAAAALGLYDAGGLLVLSVLAAVPGLAGVVIGGWLRERLPEATVGTGVVALLAIIGLRLLATGLLGASDRRRDRPSQAGSKRTTVEGAVDLSVRVREPSVLTFGESRRGRVTR
jgi:hypothetical protein